MCINHNSGKKRNANNLILTEKEGKQFVLYWGITALYQETATALSFTEGDVIVKPSLVLEHRVGWCRPLEKVLINSILKVDLISQDGHHRHQRWNPVCTLVSLFIYLFIFTLIWKKNCMKLTYYVLVFQCAVFMIFCKSINTFLFRVPFCVGLYFV